MPALHFDITANNDKLRRALDQSVEATRAASAAMESSGKSVDRLFEDLAAKAAKIGVAISAQQFAQKVVQTRAQFEQLEIAFSTLLKSKEGAERLMAEMTTLAATTPFDLQGVASGAKQLLAYGFSADSITDTLTRLGDIASGLSIPLNDIVYLYGTTKVQGRMFAQDLMQFTNRGIPLIGELASQFGVSDAEVKQLVSDGKIGFPEVETALRHLTDAGGMFGGMMANTSKSIGGQISNLGDELDMMFDEIGKSTGGVINAALGGASFLIEHWREIGNAVLTVVAAYSAYRSAALMLDGIHAAQAARLKTLTAWTNAQTVATRLSTITHQKHSAAVIFSAKAWKALAAAIKANPLGLALAAVASIGTAIWAWTKNTTKQTEAEKINAEVQQRAAEYAAEEEARVRRLNDTVHNNTIAVDKRRAAVTELSKICDGYNATITSEGVITRENTAALDQYIKKIKEAARARATEEKLEELYKQQLADEEYQRKLNNVYANQNRRAKAAGVNAQGAGQITYGGGVFGSAYKVETQNDRIANQAAATQGRLQQVQERIAQRQKTIDSLANQAAAPQSNQSNQSIKPTQPKTPSTPKKEEDKTPEALAAAARARESAETAVVLSAIRERAKREQVERELAHQDRLKQLEREKQEQLAKVAADSPAAQQIRTDYEEALLRTKETYENEEEQRREMQQAEEAQALRDYLTQYGNYYEKRRAIDEQYQADLKKLGTSDPADPRRLKLDAEYQQQRHSLTLLQAQGDLAAAEQLPAIDPLVKDLFKRVADNIAKYLETPEGKALNPQQRAETIDLQRKATEGAQGGVKDILSIKELKAATAAYSAALRLLSTAGEKQARALKDLEALEATKGANDPEVIAAQEAYTAAIAATTTAQEHAATAGARLTNSQNTAAAAITGVGGLLRAAKSGSLGDTFRAFQQLTKATKSATKAAAEAGENAGGAVGIVAAILDLVDQIGSDAHGFFQDLLTNLVGAIGRIAVNPVGIITGIGEGLVDGVAGIFGESQAEADQRWSSYLNEVKESNATMAHIVSKYGDQVTAAVSTADRNAAYKKQLWALQQQIEIAQSAFKSAEKESSRKKHSSGYYVNQNADLISAQLSTIGINATDSDSLTRLTPEQWERIRTELPKLYNQIKGWYNDGYRDAAQFIDQIADFAEQKAKIEAEYITSILGTSTESAVANFWSALQDMQSSADDLTKDFQKAAARILTQGIAGKYGKQLEKALKQLAKDQEDGTLSTTEYQQRKAEVEELARKAKEERDEIAELYGLNEPSGTAAEGTRRTLEGITDETAGELAGRMAAIEITLNDQLRGQEQAQQTRTDILLQTALAAGYLHDIRAHTALLPAIAEATRKTAANTANI